MSPPTKPHDVHLQDKVPSDDTISSEGSSHAQEEQDDVYFIIPRTVTVLYGPYSYEGIMDYRMDRLQGLKAFLEKLGVTVEMKTCLDHVDLVRVWFLDEMVFSCKISQLSFGGDGELDPLCWEAAEALENFIRVVLQGLRQSKHPPPEDLKRPFCPCFHVHHEKPKRESARHSHSHSAKEKEATGPGRQSC